MTDNYGADALTTPDRLEGTYSIGDETYDLVVEDISGHDWQILQEYSQLALQLRDGEIDDVDADDIPQFSWEPEGGTDKGFIECVVNEKLVKPEVEVANIRVHKLQPLFEGMIRTWQESDSVSEAKGEMPTSGNR